MPATFSPPHLLFFSTLLCLLSSSSSLPPLLSSSHLSLHSPPISHSQTQSWPPSSNDNVIPVSVIPVQRQGLVMSLAIGIQGQKAYGLCKTVKDPLPPPPPMCWRTRGVGHGPWDTLAWPFLKLQYAGGREFDPRPGQYNRMSFFHLTRWLVRFPHLNMPSKFWIYLESIVHVGKR